MRAPPQIFDRTARALRRDRLARGAVSPLELPIAEALIERLDDVQRDFGEALVINTGAGTLAAMLRARGLMVVETDHGAHFAVSAGATHADEDRLALGDGRFDVVFAPCGFDTIDDLPGAMIAARRMLRADGLFLAAMIGSPSLPVLRSAIASADAAMGVAVARLHPQIDVRSAGDLLVRAGFGLPVADVEAVRLRYAGVDRLFADIRATGASNVLRQRTSISHSWRAAVAGNFAAAADADGKTSESLTMVVMTGWAPALQPSLA